MYIGVDIGGMSIKAGVVNEDGVIIEKCAVPTPCNDDNACTAAMLDGVEKVLERRMFRQVI